MSLSLQEASTKARNKGHFYQGLTRIGFYLPGVKQRICNWNFLK